MVVSVGGGIESLAYGHIICSIGHPLENLKKLKIEDIIGARGIICNDLKEAIRIEADEMIEKRFLYYTQKNDAYVFSRDNLDNYFWKKATAGDRIMNNVKHYFS